MFELDERAETAGARIALQTQIADLVERHNNQALHKKTPASSWNKPVSCLSLDKPVKRRSSSCSKTTRMSECFTERERCRREDLLVPVLR